MNAGTQEELIWEGSLSQLLNLWTYILAAAAGIVIIVVTFLFIPPPFRLFLLLLIIIPVFFCLWKWLVIRNSRYRITTERIFFTTGIFSKKTDTLELYRVKDYNMYEPFWMRIFKLGNIELITFDMTSPKFFLRTVPAPADLLSKIRTSVEKRRDSKRVRGVEFDDDQFAQT